MDKLIAGVMIGYVAGAFTIMFITSPDTAVCRHVFNLPDTAITRYHDNKCWLYTDSETELKP